MEKKFANLGKMLSRTQAKKIAGGAEDEGENKCAYACVRTSPGSPASSNCDSVCPNCEKGAWGDQYFCFN